MASLASPSPLFDRAAGALIAREAELRARLHAAVAIAVAAGDERGEVSDFKEAAAQETQTAVEEVTLAHAATELDQVAAALRRLRDGSYGFCIDCGQPIEEGRLLALPAAPLCTGCATVHERIATR